MSRHPGDTYRSTFRHCWVWNLHQPCRMQLSEFWSTSTWIRRHMLVQSADYHTCTWKILAASTSCWCRQLQRYVVQAFITSRLDYYNSLCIYDLPATIISSIHKLLMQTATEIMVHTFITSRLDYCNSLCTYDLPATTISKLPVCTEYCCQSTHPNLTWICHLCCTSFTGCQWLSESPSKSSPSLTPNPTWTGTRVPEWVDCTIIVCPFVHTLFSRCQPPHHAFQLPGYTPVLTSVALAGLSFWTPCQLRHIIIHCLKTLNSGIQKAAQDTSLFSSRWK